MPSILFGTSGRSVFRAVPVRDRLPSLPDERLPILFDAMMRHSESSPVVLSAAVAPPLKELHAAERDGGAIAKIRLPP